MSWDTNDLIRHLGADRTPVRRLGSPWRRAVHWLAVALVSIVFVVLMATPRQDLKLVLADPRFQIEQLAALVTAAVAAVAAFSLIVPGRSRKILFLLIIPMAIWLTSMGVGCVRDWLRLGSDVLKIQPDWICFPAIAMAGAVPAAAMVVMLRRGAPLAPWASVTLGALAAAALGNFGLRLFHAQDAGLMVLVWQFGSVVLLSVAAGFFGRRILVWHHTGTLR